MEQFLVTPDKTHPKEHCTPDDHGDWQPDVWLELLEEDIGWDL